MSSTTMVVLIGRDDEPVAAFNTAWPDQREQFIGAETGGYKYGDAVWTCVFNNLDRDLLLDRIRSHPWVGTVWVAVRHEDAEQYDMLTIRPPEPGATQPSPFTATAPAERVVETGPCSCGVVCSARMDPQYGTVWHCSACGREYVDER